MSPARPPSASGLLSQSRARARPRGSQARYGGSTELLASVVEAAGQTAGKTAGQTTDKEAPRDEGERDGGVLEFNPAPADEGPPSYRFTPRGRRMVYRDPEGRYIATLHKDGSVVFRDRIVRVRPALLQDVTTGAPMGGVSLRFDPSDAIMKVSGDDPFARDKSRLLAATAQQRAGMARSHFRRRVVANLERLTRELEELWLDDGRSLAARKELLFQRWDECAEVLAADADVDTRSEALARADADGESDPGSDVIDAARREAAGAVRARIIRFIRNVAPPESAAAFTPAEIADMNGRRTSVSRFDPYS